MNRVRPMRHIDNLFDSNRHFLEKSAFGVCQFLGERMRINPARIRLYFIYSSFVTFGSPFVLYLVIAFWLNVHKYISSGVKRMFRRSRFSLSSGGRGQVEAMRRSGCRRARPST